jgi:hypothetical protein
LVFGSGLAIVLFLREGVVETHHWLTPTSSSTPWQMGSSPPAQW